MFVFRVMGRVDPVKIKMEMELAVGACNNGSIHAKDQDDQVNAQMVCGGGAQLPQVGDW